MANVQTNNQTSSPAAETSAQTNTAALAIVTFLFFLWGFLTVRPKNHGSRIADHGGVGVAADTFAGMSERAALRIARPDSTRRMVAPYTGPSRARRLEWVNP
jgi:hypothetical protein